MGVADKYAEPRNAPEVAPCGERYFTPASNPKCFCRKHFRWPPGVGTSVAAMYG